MFQGRLKYQAFLLLLNFLWLFCNVKKTEGKYFLSLLKIKIENSTIRNRKIFWLLKNIENLTFGKFFPTNFGYFPTNFPTNFDVWEVFSDQFLVIGTKKLLWIFLYHIEDIKFRKLQSIIMVMRFIKMTVQKLIATLFQFSTISNHYYEFFWRSINIHTRVIDNLQIEDWTNKQMAEINDLDKIIHIR